MSFIKASLKAAKDAILAENYENALDFLSDVLEEEPDNYNALLLKGKTLSLTDQFADSAHCYKQAIRIKPSQPLPWKGLLDLYNRAKDWNGYLEALVGLAQCCESIDDLPTARSAFIAAQGVFKKSDIPKDAQQKFLELQLPGSPLYDFLKGSMVDALTITKRLVTMVSQKEETTIKALRRRVDISKANKDTKIFDILTSSKLPGLYEDLLNYSDTSLDRRFAQSSLLDHYLEVLKVAPPSNKEVREIYAMKLKELVSGIMVIGAAIAKAWTLGINWLDPKNFGDMPLEDLRYYIEKFPNEGTAKVLHGFLHSKLSPFPISNGKAGDRKELTPSENDDENPQDSNKKENKDEMKNSKAKVPKDKKKKKGDSKKAKDVAYDLWPESSVLEYFTDGFDLDSLDVLSFRIVGEFYLESREYETAADIARKGLAAVKKMEAEYLVKLPNTHLHLSVILGTSYIYYDAPKNYGLAAKVFNEVLQTDKENVAAKVGKGLILREQGQLSKAYELLHQVSEDYPENYQVLYEVSLCLLKQGHDEQARQGFFKCLDHIPRADLLSADLRAKILWEIGNSWLNVPASERKTFEYYAKALQENPNFGPAYTSLGNYYSNFANDEGRAMKCYFKAFEIDSGEIEAAEKLASGFAAKSEWDMVDVVAGRVASSDKIRFSKGSEGSWPFRALGVVAINKKDFGAAVSHFQKALRLNSKDTASWVGLGEAYTQSGRYNAGSKAFERALSIDEGLWAARLHLGLVQREMLQYDNSLSTLKALTEQLEGENLYKVQSVYLETLVQYARYKFMQDFYVEAVESSTSIIEIALTMVKTKKKELQKIWKCVANAIEIFISVGTKVEDAPLSDLQQLMEIGTEHQSNSAYESSLEDINNGTDLVSFMVNSVLFSQLYDGDSKLSKSIAAYNTGVSYMKAAQWSQGENRSRRLAKATEYIKDAISLDPRNAEYWNAYGIISANYNARVSQHCFIRSLRFNENDPCVWGNLAALYFQSGDYELAKQAYERAQSIDPENSLSWLGMALVSFISGDSESAKKYFEHSFLLSKGDNYLSKLFYGFSIYEDTVSRNLTKGYEEDFDRGILGLEKLLSLRPDNEAGLKIQSNLLERDSNYEYAILYVKRLIGVIEKRYEESNLDEDIVKYATSKAQLARLYLSIRDFQKSLDEAEAALGVIAENTEGNGPIHLSALLTAGLANFSLKKFDDSIEYFKQALEVSEEDADVIVLLVQVLWAQGGEEEREVAVEQLYGSINEAGSTPLKITLLLGVLGVLQNSELSEAAEEELDNISADRLEQDVDNNVPEVLSYIKKSPDPWQTSALIWPSNYRIWKEVDTSQALEVAKISKISSEELAEAYSEGDDSIDGAQMGVFLAPWKAQQWNKLAEGLSEVS